MGKVKKTKPYAYFNNFLCYFGVSMNMKHLLIIAISFISFAMLGQTPNNTKVVKMRKMQQLAHKYFSTGEYEKAAKLYKNLHEMDGRSTRHFNKYLESLITGKEYEKTLTEAKKELKKKPHATQLYVYYARACDALGRDEEEESYYLKAIQSLSGSGSTIVETAKAFEESNKPELAIQTYLKGNEILKDNHRFAANLAKLYRDIGDKDKMIKNYLLQMKSHKGKGSMNYYLQLLRARLSTSDIKLLQKEVYARLQEENPDDRYYEVLEWSFLQLKEYKKALRQARSIDRRTEGNGAKVMEMGRIAQNGGDIETATDAYQYILKTYGSTSAYYLSAQSGLSTILKAQILAIPGEKDAVLVDSLTRLYETTLDTRGKNRETAKLMVDYANVLALINNDTKKAKDLLQEVIKLGDVDRKTKASAKIDLADYLLIDGDRWESTLLYSQVDKDLQEAELGETARFRNAMLSYYNGDFEWAQEQFDVLKRSTSRLISNDAIDMSVFIQDNLGLDTTAIPLELFSESDLLIFQNKYDEAFDKLDSIEILYPDHGLLDDILYRKASMYKEMGKYDEAVEAYTTVIEKYKDEIKADNALYELAKMYEEVLNNKEEAKKLYERLFLDYTMSTFTVDARKRFRALRKEST